MVPIISSAYLTGVPIATLPPPKLGQLGKQLGQQQKQKQNKNKLGSQGNPLLKRPKRDKLLKVLDMLCELGIVHSVDKNKRKGGPPGPAKPTASPGKAVQTGKEGIKKEGVSKGASDNETSTKLAPAEDDPNPIYCFGNGAPRMDVVLPSQILDEIREAGQEVLRMRKRIELLRKALRTVDETKIAAEEKKDEEARKAAEAAQAAAMGLAPAVATKADDVEDAKTASGKRKRTKQPPTAEKQAMTALKQIFQLHPEVLRDPVYAAALRMFRVNTGDNVDPLKLTVENTPDVELIAQKVLYGNSNSGRPNRGGNKKRNPSTGKFETATVKLPGNNHMHKAQV